MQLTLPPRDWVNAAVQRLEGPGLVMAFLDEGEGQIGVLTNAQDLNPAMAEVAALDILRQTLAVLTADRSDCALCGPCQERLGRIRSAVAALSIDGPVLRTEAVN